MGTSVFDRIISGYTFSNINFTNSGFTKQARAWEDSTTSCEFTIKDTSFNLGFVQDGHGRSSYECVGITNIVVLLTEKLLPAKLYEKFQSLTDFSDANIKDAITSVFDELQNIFVEEKFMYGACIAGYLIYNGRCCWFNMGDTSVFLVKGNGKHVFLSTPHNLKTPGERERLTEKRKTIQNPKFTISSDGIYFGDDDIRRIPTRAFGTYPIAFLGSDIGFVDLENDDLVVSITDGFECWFKLEQIASKIYDNRKLSSEQIAKSRVEFTYFNAVNYCETNPDYYSVEQIDDISMIVYKMIELSSAGSSDN
jgi:serine/threonine protein phosphatase PrpC